VALYLHRKSLVWGAFLVCVVALGLTGCTSEPAAADTKGKFKGKGKNGGPVPVVTAVANVRDVPIEIQVVGNVEAYSSVSVRAQVSGQLTSVSLRDGDFVKKGDPLFTIDSRQIDGQLAQAEANLARSMALQSQAEANLARDSAQASYSRNVAERFAQGQKDGIFTVDQAQQSRANADALAQGIAADNAAIASAKAQIEADKANVNNIQLQKSYTSIPAPVDGRVGIVTQKLGNIVTANSTELAVIAQVEPIYVTFAVPEARLNEITSYFDRGGKLPVAAQPQDGSGKQEHGDLSFIDNAVDTTTGTIKLKGTFKNMDHSLWPGQFVNVTLQLTTRQNAVTVPNQAVQTGQDGTFIYVVGEDRKVQFRPVKIGPRVDLDVVIDDGIKPGDVVVTDGQLRLQPGSEVQTGGGRQGAPRDSVAPADGKEPDKSGPVQNSGDLKGKAELKGKSDKGKRPADGA
jgi:multidrug efflux system membrane fusion protein